MLKIKKNTGVPKNYTGIIECEDGRKSWFKEGKLHREDGPAVEFLKGTKCWYKEGKLHRLDGPAIEWANGTKQWNIENYFYSSRELSNLFSSSFFLGKERGRYNLEWLKFLTEEGIQEFPIIPGMKEYKDFKKAFETLEGMGNK